MLSLGPGTLWQHGREVVRVRQLVVSRGYVLVEYVEGQPEGTWDHNWLDTRLMGPGMWWQPVGQQQQGEASNGTR
jgi:hypothetical protein